MSDQQTSTAPQVADGRVNQSIQAFSFGDPSPVLGGRAVFDYLECWFNGRWYEPPLSLDGLSRSVGSSVHLHSGLTFKRNLLSKTFIPHRLLSRAAFEQFALDFLSLGNGYIEARRSMLGSTFQLKPALAKYMRAGQGRTVGIFWFRAGRKSMSLTRAASSTCAKPICTRRCTACRNGSAPCSRRFSTSRRLYFAASTTKTAAMPDSSST